MDAAGLSNMRASLFGACIIALVPSSVFAQSSPPPTEVVERPHIAAAMKVAEVFSQPLHPVLKGVGIGGGFGGGLGYDFPRYRGWKTNIEALATVNGFWSVEGIATYQRRRGTLEPYARVRDMPALRTFGPGPHSVAADRLDFGMRDASIGARAEHRLTSWLALGGRIEQLWIDTDAAPSPLRFGRVHARADFISPAGPVGARYQGGKTRIGYGAYIDQQLDRYSFRRLDLETKHRFTLFGPPRSLTLHGWLSTTDASAGQDVPFFLQHTLGGKGHLRGVNEQILGSDGTEATLRGFPSLRFRDRHLLLLQAEYRLPVWGPIDATLFVDAGTVASRRRDLEWRNLRRSYGFSLGVMRAGDTVARMDVGFGGEGVQVILSAGRPF